MYSSRSESSSPFLPRSASQSPKADLTGIIEQYDAKRQSGFIKLLDYGPHHPVRFKARNISNKPSLSSMILIYKQTKNRHETGSNLSLGTRLTVLSKRLGRKRCCDATPDRCLGAVPPHYLCFAL